MDKHQRNDVLQAVPERVDPIELARRDLRKQLPKRFYKDVAVAKADAGFAVHLDGRGVRTPAKAPLVLPTEALAEHVAAEWRAQREWIEPDTMPLTRLVNSAIDGVAKAMAETAAEIARFAESDLVCYRAAEPPELVDAQSRAWDPILAFARDELVARFVCAEGVMFVRQPEAAIASVRRAVDEIAAGPDGALRLAALSVMTSLTGSVLLALAVVRHALRPDAAWTAAHVDEDFQMARWGSDREAVDRRTRRARDWDAAVRVFKGSAGDR